MWLAVIFLVLSYIVNLIFSNDPIMHRVFIIINVWNVLSALLLILPGFLLTEAAEKLANRFGEPLEIEKRDRKLSERQFYTDFLSSNIFFIIVILVYFILMITFVVSEN